MAAQFRKGIDLNNQRATAAADPSAATDLATKQYVDNVARGLDWKNSVRAATTANITLSGTQTIDGVALAAGDRVLVKDQTTGSANGIYDVAAGAWSRSADADTNAEVTSGMAVTVTEGTVNGDKVFVLTTNDPITLGTTALVFSQLGGGTGKTAGAGLTEDGTSYNVGAGAGISVAADSVGIDTNVVVRKFAASCVATTDPQTFAHGLGTADGQVTIRRTSDGVVVFADVTIDTTNVTVGWGAAPAAGEYRVSYQA